MIEWNRGELEELQRVENKVWRQILGAPSYVAVAALRGELGASNMIMRDMKTKLNMVDSAGRGDWPHFPYNSVFLDEGIKM